METSDNRQNKLQERVAKTAHKIPSDYSMNARDLNDLYSLSRQDLFEALMLAYDFGFIRGTRAKARGRVSIL